MDGNRYKNLQKKRHSTKECLFQRKQTIYTTPNSPW